MIGAEKGVVGVISGSEIIHRPHDLLERRLDFAAPAERVAGDAAAAHVMDHHRDDVIQFGAMLLDICAGAKQPFLLAIEENEADRPLRPQMCGFYRPGCLDDERRVATVIEAAGSQIPGIEMSAEDDDFSRFFGAAYFGHYVSRLKRPADFIWQ